MSKSEVGASLGKLEDLGTTCLQTLMTELRCGLPLRQCVFPCLQPSAQVQAPFFTLTVKQRANKHIPHQEAVGISEK